MSKEKANERINSQVTPAKGKSSTTTFVVAIAGVIILILGGVVLFQVFGNAEDQATNNKVITPENVEAIIAELDETDYTPVGSFEVSMPTIWNFPDGLSASTDAFVDNVANNRNTIYFTVALESALDDEIYHSPFIEVGARLEAEDIKLDLILESGTYDAVMTYYLVDEDMQDVSEVSVGITLVVES
jgi:hypothetical protein